MKHLSLKVIITLFACATLLLSCNNQSTDKKSKAGAEAESPSENGWTSLFNGENLEGWYTYQMRPEPTSVVAGLLRDEQGNYLEPIGLNKDPLQIFTVVSEEEEPAIRISGEVFSILVTEQEFENYHLKLQFKWGSAKYPPRKNEKRDSGILYHSVGSEGAWGGVWMRSLECQVQEGDCGDYISVDTVLADISAQLEEENNLYLHVPGSEILTFSPEVSYCHKSEDFEKPNGEWNTMEIYTVDGKSVHVVNGQVNMRLSNSRQIVDGQEQPLTKGKIQLQSEGAEIFYRQVEIKNIDEIPAGLLGSE
jgi:hypothetical protein